MGQPKLSPGFLKSNLKSAITYEIYADKVLSRLVQKLNSLKKGFFEDNQTLVSHIHLQKGKNSNKITK
jgi:hypothetical protein